MAERSLHRPGTNGGDVINSTKPGPVQETRTTPDPSEETIRRIYREIEWIREFYDARLIDYDKAIQLVQGVINRSPTIAEVVARIEEKFASIQVQFTERDTRTEQTSRDSKVAVDAALQAAKEAVGEQNKSSALAIAKSEASTTKQIDQQAILLSTATKALDDKITDLKDRMTSTEGRSKGLDAGWGYLVGGVGVLIAILTLIVMMTKPIAH